MQYVYRWCTLRPVHVNWHHYVNDCISEIRSAKVSEKKDTNIQQLQKRDLKIPQALWNFEQLGHVNELKAMATSGNHWLRLFDSMDLTQDGEALQTPWCGHFTSQM